MKAQDRSAAPGMASECPTCGNTLSPSDCVPNSIGAMCCSCGCAAMSDMVREERAATYSSTVLAGECTNCGREIMSFDDVWNSPDGLSFCSAACERMYPKPIGGREFRLALIAAAFTVLALTAVMLICIIYRFK